MSNGLLSSEITQIVDSIYEGSRKIFQDSITVHLNNNEEINNNSAMLELDLKSIELIRSKLQEQITALDRISGALESRIIIMNEISSSDADNDGRKKIIEKHFGRAQAAVDKLDEEGK